MPIEGREELGPSGIKGAKREHSFKKELGAIHVE